MLPDNVINHTILFTVELMMLQFLIFLTNYTQSYLFIEISVLQAFPIYRHRLRVIDAECVGLVD